MESLSKFEFGGGETVIKTAEAKNKIMIYFYGWKEWASCDCEAQYHQSCLNRYATDPEIILVQCWWR